MSKKKSSRAPRRASAPAVKEDLRTAPPVRRMRLILAKLFEDVRPHLDRLAEWAEKNLAAVPSREALFRVVDGANTFGARMTEFEATGWSPPRKSFTAKTSEGDRVAILEDMRGSYSDILDPNLMGDLLVVKKHPGNKGGGLVVEASDGSKIKVSISHVVKLS